MRLGKLGREPIRSGRKYSETLSDVAFAMLHYVMLFDTLLLSVSNAFRKEIGISHSLLWSENKERYPLLREPKYPEVPFQPSNRLRLGYLSYDFNDHPTAHMIEGLIKHHRRHRVDGTAYSYGKHDNSVYRERIEREMDHFVDQRLFLTWCGKKN